MQKMLMDRRMVYKTLQDHDIPVPTHVFLNRDSQEEQPEIIQHEDYIEINGVRIEKPFVEKPVDGDDHNIHIYYPMSAGGGCKRLFRKVGNRSSEFHPDENSIRTEGSYIYEEFLSTQGTDVKVYTIGPNYAHAEARKSPVLDGKVMRDRHGKEVRYPVILSTEEKDIARKVCRAFEQTICGFDILRVQQGSFVCDVNGWSFVKNSAKYYEDCSILLRKFLLRAYRYRLEGDISKQIRSISLDFDEEQLDTDVGGGSASMSSEDYDGADEELRCVIAVIRHGDRTPKQKMKMDVCHDYFLNYYHKRAKTAQKDLKIKAVADLEELLDIARKMTELYEQNDPEYISFLQQRDKEHNEDPSDRIQGIRTLREVLEGWQLRGINRKVQLKPKSWTTLEDGTMRANRILLILKWGGDLTQFGMQQAETLGGRFRHEMYPGADDGGLLRLHSTYRHDLKIYTSDEGRVQKTAAAFAKGFLELEGDIIPILVSLVLKGKNANSMLDQSGTSAQETIFQVKARLHDILHRGDDCSSLKRQSKSDFLRSVAAALDEVEQPMKKMERIHKRLGSLKDQLLKMASDQAGTSLVGPSGRETLPVIAERWAKLYRDFYSSKKNTFDLSKIPDIHDCIRYDAMHNAHLKLLGVRELLEDSQSLSHALVPQEYGMHIHEKLKIGRDMCRNLLKKIRDDFDIARGLETYRLDPQYAKDKYIKSAHRSVRTRLYFTSESHIQTLLNVLRFKSGSISSPITDEAREWISDIPELCYMTHIVIRIFERFEFEPNDPRRFRAQVMLSPGATGDPIDVAATGKPSDVEPARVCSDEDLTCDQLQKYICEAIGLDDISPVHSTEELPTIYHK